MYHGYSQIEIYTPAPAGGKGERLADDTFKEVMKMFLTEKRLKDTFWKNYNYSGRAIRWQFECPIREGCADLITIEKYQGNFQINAFEFKLDDIKKAILQAKENYSFVNKSWIVIPVEKKDLIMNRYYQHLKENGIGVITVEEKGHWEILIQAKYRKEVQMNQIVINLMMQNVEVK